MTPGSLPWDAMFRKQIRQMPNFRINARGLPHKGHRLYARTLNFGSRCALMHNDVFANSTSLERLFTERHPEQSEQLASLFIGSRRRHDADIHSFDLIDFIVIDFGEDDVFPDADGIIAPAVERFG